jgi:hypothetical protein
MRTPDERKARKAAMAKKRNDAMTPEQRSAVNARKAARARELYAVNPHARRAGNNRSLIKQRYGISAEQKDAMLADQGGICAICLTDSPATATRWHVDHCHSTNVVRGILCQHCNNMLGMARDRADILERAIKYLGGKK